MRASFQRFHKRLASKRLAAHVAVGERAARMTEEIVGLPTGSVRAITTASRWGVPGRRVSALCRICRRRHSAASPTRRASTSHARARSPSSDVSAVIVGDGPERAALEALAAELGVSDRLLITGWQDEPRSYLSSIDVYCLPSRFEGFPLAVVEAMLAGLPIVASDVGSVSEAIRDGETGQLVPPEDPAALAGAIRKLLDDRELAQRLGERAQALAMEQFTAERMARAYESMYDEILGR